MSLCITGIGTAVPPHHVGQQEAAEAAQAVACRTPQQARLLAALYRRAGVQRRHSVVLQATAQGIPVQQSFYPLPASDDDRGPTTAARMQRYAEHAPVLAAEASAKALTQADVDARQITHLVTVSCSGFTAPGFDLELVDRLGLARHVARTHIGFMGCHAALNALRVARAFVEADPRACVLLCAVELCSLHHQYGWVPEQLVANALFADGAAALVCRHERAGQAEHRLRLAASGSWIIPNSSHMMTWRVGDHGFEMGLAAEVPEIIQQNLGSWLEEWLSRHGQHIDTVGCWGVHPGGPRILNAVLDATGLPAEALASSFAILADYGNMSSPTMLFILERLRQAQTPGPCVLLGFGPGLTVEAVLLDEPVR